MLNKIGRLDLPAIREIDELMNEIFDALNKKSKASQEKGRVILYQLAKSPNYFVREYAGEKMAKSELKGMPEIAATMLEHHLYGIRATALFYYYNLHKSEPDKIIEYLEKTYDTIPWEAESIIYELWKRFPIVMKERMGEWLTSEDDKKRAISFHGMENLSGAEPAFIMEFIGKAIDDESMEVQKKITHILTQVARLKPAICYPYIHEWLLTADEKRIKTMWVSMKKLANIVIQKSKRDKTQEFIILTQRTIADWRHDDNKSVAEMGSKLYHIIHHSGNKGDKGDSNGFNRNNNRNNYRGNNRNNNRNNDRKYR